MGTLLVVSDNINGFICHSLCEELEKSKISIIRASLEDERVGTYISESNLIMLVVSDEFDARSIFFNSFRRKYAEAPKAIVVHGSADRVADITETFTMGKVVESFIRPIANNLVIEKVSKILEKLDNPDRRKRILVVDDSGPMLRTIMGWLEGEYDVALANSATQALGSITREKPDLILLDYEMPVCSGPQFFRMLKEDDNTKDIPVIFLTAQSDANSVKEVLVLKPQGYILKTSSGAVLLAKLREYFSAVRNG